MELKDLKSSNPALNKKTFAGREYDGTEPMTIQGTVNKTIMMLLLVVATAFITWSMVANGENTVLGFMVLGLLLGFIFAMVTIFKKNLAPVTAPLYAVCEGLVLGGISALYEQMYNGITLQAVGLTFAVLFVLLIVYKTGVIKVTENFKLMVVCATGAVALVYVVDIILMFLGMSVPFIHDSGPVGIAISLVIVAIAALNLVLDFDFIEDGIAKGLPKYMEWYGAFGLLVTLIWLYLEILRLLSKIRK